jgi:hypothetical protein
LAISSLLVLLTGCQGLSGVTSGTADAPNQCTSQEVRQVAQSFIDAFNRGDIAQLDILVSSQQFGHYSTPAPGRRLNADAFDRSTLMAYFAARHQQHEHLVLNSLDITYTNGTGGGFHFFVTRSADDGLPPTRYDGKGGVQCTTRPISLTIWAMDAHPWSPIELLPVAAALILIAVAIGTIVLWRRRAARRLASPTRATTNITR